MRERSLGEEPTITVDRATLNRDRDSINLFLRRWATAWSAQKVPEYLAYYAADFVPSGQLLQEDWRVQRRQRLEGPQRIEVTLSDLLVLKHTGDQVVVEFVQDYDSERLSDRVIKRLDLRRRAMADGRDDWRIVRERTLGFAPPLVVRATQQADDLASARRVLQDWASTWAAQDVAGYLNNYSSRFTPPNRLSRQAWEKLRRSRIETPAWIEVGLDKFALTDHRGDQIQVDIQQTYRSDLFSDRVRKRFDLQRVDRRWQILRERSFHLAGE